MTPRSLEIIQSAEQASEVTDAVTVGVGEGAHVELIDDGILVPRRGRCTAHSLPQFMLIDRSCASHCTPRGVAKCLGNLRGPEGTVREDDPATHACRPIASVMERAALPVMVEPHRWGRLGPPRSLWHQPPSPCYRAGIGCPSWAAPPGRRQSCALIQSLPLPFAIVYGRFWPAPRYIHQAWIHRRRNRPG